VSFRRFILAFAIAQAVLGCAHKNPATQPAENFGDPHWDSTALTIKQEPVAVAEGEAPLIHLFDVGGPVRVVDTTSKTQLVSSVLADRTLLSIDARRGIVAGSTVLAPGPLPAGHRYTIYVDPTTENVYRRGIGRPQRIDQPGPAPTTGKLP
jgi:hypothetical protein